MYACLNHIFVDMLFLIVHCWPASCSHGDLFIYLGRSAAVTLIVEWSMVV